MSGRGAGKTRTGVEFVTLCARKGLDGAILGRRGTELVNTHVAEIIANAHPEFVPVHWSSKDILEWPNGAITYLFSAEKPENIRSVNLSYAWVDEAAFMDEIETAWMNLTLATRVKSPGNPIHMLITSTPTGTPWVMKMEDDPDVEVRRVSTYANRANLDGEWLAQLEKEHEGTRMGRQEIHGEVLRDVEGALWNDDMFKHLRVDAPDFAALLDGMDDRVLAVDPAGSKGARSDATGIIGVGAQHFDDDGSALARSNLFVLGRATIKGSPSEWAERVFSAARLMRVNRIVAEKNYGGDMVKQVLSDWAALNPTKAKDENGEDFRIEVVHAVQNKETRAEGVVGKYEQGTVTHVTSPTAYGDLSELEKQQVTWVPKSRGGRMPSPNDIDALVWAVRALETKVKFAGQMATQANLRSKLRGTPFSMSRPTPTPAAVTQRPVGPWGAKKTNFPHAAVKRMAGRQ
jgi:phage terminase large subunit-like protein